MTSKIGQNIKGLSFIDPSGRVFNTPPAKLLSDLDSLPFPDMSIVHGFKPENIYPISTSRGCPFDCKFCSVIQMFGRKYRYRSVEKTIEDIKKAFEISKSTIFLLMTILQPTGRGQKRSFEVLFRKV